MTGTVEIAVKRLSQLSSVNLNGTKCVIKLMYVKLLLIMIDCNQVCLKEEIGHGGYGTVYKANWRGLMVAAKVIPLQGVPADAYTVKAEIEFLKLVICLLKILIL